MGIGQVAASNIRLDIGFKVDGEDPRRFYAFLQTDYIENATELIK